MTRPVFDPEHDPSQATPSPIHRDLLGETDAIKAEIKRSGKAPRPRDAATLVLFRRDADQPRILMGCRSSGHDFMPNKYVFPGGRVDPADGDAPALSELREAELQALSVKSRRRPRAFPLAAIREMFEETGLLVGRSSPVAAKTVAPDGWSAFFASGVLPSLDPFVFLGRAITPPMRHKRFDARFFMADAADCLLDDRPPVDGRELADLRWLTLAETADLDLPNVTRYVISEIEARLVRAEGLRPFHLHWSSKGHVQSRL